MNSNKQVGPGIGLMKSWEIAVNLTPIKWEL